ncbi:hypothetical protein OBBRIDRAFT_797141 [Obba rivulosa]|uniref:Uncharacterized protein n=1 Tax=Obba rivulosa TaxID=1052685 RepID=A0A8E2AQW9_9APHY|nr:hypothetical protein OBBRIDRAFT_797141 [Obba rivulosa]
MSSPSLISVTTASSCKSTSTLVPRTQSRTRKDFFSAFGKLQSFYGNSSALVASAQKSAAPTYPAPAKASKAADTHFETAGSTATTKQYEAAFGVLSSSYGFGGTAPMLPSRKSSKQ